MSDSEAPWPHGEPLANPAMLEFGVHTGTYCNAQLIVNGKTVGYCEKIVTSYDRGLWFWRIKARTHQGPHIVTWK